MMMPASACGGGSNMIGGPAGDGGGEGLAGGGSPGGGGGGSGKPCSMSAVKSVRWLMLQKVVASPPKKVTDSRSTPRMSGGAVRACSDVFTPTSLQLAWLSSQ